MDHWDFRQAQMKYLGNESKKWMNIAYNEKRERERDSSAIPTKEWDIIIRRFRKWTERDLDRIDTDRKRGTIAKRNVTHTLSLSLVSISFFPSLPSNQSFKLSFSLCMCIYGCKYIKIHKWLQQDERDNVTTSFEALGHDAATDRFHIQKERVFVSSDQTHLHHHTLNHLLHQPNISSLII